MYPQQESVKVEPLGLQTEGSMPADIMRYLVNRKPTRILDKVADLLPDNNSTGDKPYFIMKSQSTHTQAKRRSHPIEDHTFPPIQQ